MVEWDRSHEYVLKRIFHEIGEVTVHFAENVPSIAELVALRKLVPQFASTPPSSLKKILGESGQFALGETDGMIAREQMDRARKLGLTAKFENLSRMHYLIYDKTAGTACACDDEDENNEMVKAMLAAGVPVEHIEG